MSSQSVPGVASSSSGSNSYYCHQCHTNFTLVSVPSDDSSAVCPRCEMGFIEELPDPPTGARSLNSPQDLFETINVLAGRPSGDASAPMAFIGLPHFMQELSDIFANFDGTRDHQIHLIQPNTGMTMHSNPGDYVFGGAGIDTIVTQIFNQPLDGVGPPPLDKELIKKIPTVKISTQQVASGLQCSVCWEDFVLQEPVRELKCDHFFHDQCIIPWLELHGTCPVCREFQQQGESQANKEEHSTANASAAVSSSYSTTTSTSSNTDSPAGGNIWSSLANAADLNDIFTSTINRALRNVEFPSSSSSSSEPSSSVSTTSTSETTSSDSSAGSSESNNASSSASSNNYYYDFDLE